MRFYFTLITLIIFLIFTEGYDAFVIGITNSKSIKIIIVSDELLVEYNKNTATFKDNVEIQYDDVFLSADKVVIDYENPDKNSNKTGNPDTENVNQHTIQNLTATKNVILKHPGNKLIVKSNKAFLNTLTNTIELSGNVEITQNDNHARAKIVIYEIKNKQIKLKQTKIQLRVNK